MNNVNANSPQNTAEALADLLKEFTEMKTEINAISEKIDTITQTLDKVTAIREEMQCIAMAILQVTNANNQPAPAKPKTEKEEREV